MTLFLLLFGVMLCAFELIPGSAFRTEGFSAIGCVVVLFASFGLFAFVMCMHLLDVALGVSVFMRLFWWVCGLFGYWFAMDHVGRTRALAKEKRSVGMSEVPQGLDIRMFLTDDGELPLVGGADDAEVGRSGSGRSG